LGHSKGTSCRTPLAKILDPPLGQLIGSRASSAGFALFAYPVARKCQGNISEEMSRQGNVRSQMINVRFLVGLLELSTEIVAIILVY